MPAVARVTWDDNFRVSLPFVSSDSITSEELTREESNQQQSSAACYLYQVKIESGHNLWFKEYTLHSVFIHRLSRVTNFSSSFVS